MRVGRFAQGLAVLGWAVSALPDPWTVPKLLLLAGVIAGGACLFYGLFVLQATLAFWTVETLEIMNTVTYGGTETGQYPLTIYRPWFRRFFTFVVPLAAMNYLPAPVLLHRPAPPGMPPLLPWLAPGVGVLFLLLALQIWKIGVRHYTSTGSVRRVSQCSIPLAEGKNSEEGSWVIRLTCTRKGKGTRACRRSRRRGEGAEPSCGKTRVPGQRLNCLKFNPIRSSWGLP